MNKRIRLMLAVVMSYVFSCGAAMAKEEDNKVHHIVEERASFPGGMLKQISYTEKHLKYPKECEGSGVEGRMIVSFIVEKNGKFSDIKVETHLSDCLDAEAVRFVKSMPKWTPGKIGGKKVRTYNSMMLFFTSQNN